MGQLSSKDIIATARALSEAKASFKEADAKRTASKTLLKPDELAGDYDVARRLMTTLGGKPRVLTHEDLKQFAHEARKVKNERKKGVTAKDIIDLSWPSDRARANSEIRTATPISTTGGTIRFMTNAGPNSDKTRHYVTVEVRNFGAVVSSGIKVDKTGAELAKSPLGIHCDCGRWRYFLAYVGTVGGYIAKGSPLEPAFPKQKNPGLSGIACKHILRTVAVLSQTPFMKQYMSNMVKKARDRVEDVQEHEKVADARNMTDEIKKASWRQKQIRTTEEKRAARASSDQKAALARAAKNAANPKKVAVSTRKAESKINNILKNSRELSQAERQELIARLIAESIPKGK